MEKNATIEDIVMAESAELGYPSLKDKQLLAITELVSGHDVLPREEVVLISSL